MNTRNIIYLGLAVVFAGQNVHAEANGDNRRYEGVVASANSVWVIDTRSGKVRKCTQEFAD